jgi:tetratricopeptide (TPR) repeat protein
MPNLAKKPVFARRCLIVTASLLILAVVGYGGLRLYRKLEPTRLAKRARVYFEKGDLNNAMLTLRQALNINKNNVACARLLAEIAESGGDPGAIDWRSKLVDLQPGLSAAVFECAETALRFGKPAIAEQILGKLHGPDKDNARSHELSGQSALAAGKFDLAVEHFQKALDRDAKNESYRLNYAASLLERGLLEDRAAGRASLEKLVATPKLRVPALRALVKDSIANRDLPTAIRLVRELTGKPDASFSDQMTLLNLLRRTGSPDLSPTLAPLKTSARGKVPQMIELIAWMNSNDRAREAVEWSNEFSIQEWADSRVCAAVAKSSLTLREWGRIQVLANCGGWGNLQQDLLHAISLCGTPLPLMRSSRQVQKRGSLEYVRCALLARSLREQGRDGEGAKHWAAAVAAAAAQPGATPALARLVAEWGWTAELESLLPDVLNDPKEFDWAANLLLRRLARKKDTHGLWEVTARVISTSPANDAVRNNYAMFSLLLGRDVLRASQFARKHYEAYPREAKYVSTYAFSLYVLNHPEGGEPLMRSLAPDHEAVRVMRSLAPDQLETPDVAAYYGILLAATGNREEAVRFLDLAKGADLLPEEAELVRQARRKVE